MSEREAGDLCWIRLRILGPQDAESCYRVEAELDDGSWYQHKMRLGDEEERELISIAPGDTQTYGAKLYQLLFPDREAPEELSLREALQTAWGAADASESRQLRVQLWISEECSELHRFRWERLFVPLGGKWRSLANFNQTPFSRFTRLPLPEPRLDTKSRPLKVLMAVANPANLADLPGELAKVEVETEIRDFYEAVKSFPEVFVTFVPGGTGIKDRELLAALKPPRFRIIPGSTTIKLIQQQLANHHILHFVGHGVFEKGRKIALPNDDAPAAAEGSTEAPPRELNKRATWLVMEKDDGSVDTVEDFSIVHRLIQRGDGNMPRLIFLSSCDTSKYDERNPRPFTSLGPRLVEAGFPAVVAMQDKVPVEVARELTQNFYGNLLEEGVIDSALNRSRWFLYDEKKLLDNWTIPVLFMRTPRGQLFTSDPRRLALRAISQSQQFSPSWDYDYLPLEAVVLVRDQIKTNWENTVMLTRARVELSQQLERLFYSDDLPSPLVIALTGERGTARSTTARAIIRETAARSLAPTDEATHQVVLPIYIDLAALVVASGRVPSYLNLLTQSLKSFWPEPLTEELMYELLGTDKFRLVFDNGDDLPTSQRNQLLEELGKLVGKFPNHQYLITMGRGGWRLEQDRAAAPKVKITHLLDVQPLSRYRIEKFLDKCADNDVKAAAQKAALIGNSNPATNETDDGSKSAVCELRQQLERTQLFDLAAMPWMLVQMIKQAQTGILPMSRVGVLQDLIEEKVSFITQWRGQQARALDTLYELAYQMQRQNLPNLPIKDALVIITRVRENREYALEEMLDSLIEQELLANAGSDAVRFLYPQYQAYCCAQYLCREKNPKLWEDITAGLGRITHLRRWNDTLTLLSGLLDDPYVLLEKIAYATSLKDGEQVYLAARCLLEARQAGNLGKATANDGEPPESYVESLVLDALVWRSDSTNEPRAYQRLRAVEALGRQATPESVHFLTRIAMEKTRTNSRTELDFEYGGIRQAAGRSLRRLVSGKDSEEKTAFADELLKASPCLEELIRKWLAEEIDWLEAKMKQPLDAIKDETELKTAEALAGMAAFALGDLRHPEADAKLIRAFKDDSTSELVRWAVTDALAVLDPEVVIKAAVHKVLDSGQLNLPTAANGERREQLIYLIGQLRHPDERALAFVEQALQSSNVPYDQKGRAMLAIGYLHPPKWEEWKGVFEQAALGNFEVIKIQPQNDYEALYLRTKALQALAEIGDLQTLETLRKGRQQWPLEIERIFYSTSEEIVWRKSG